MLHTFNDSTYFQNFNHMQKEIKQIVYIVERKDNENYSNLPLNRF